MPLSGRMRPAALHVALASRWIHHRAGPAGPAGSRAVAPDASRHLLERLADALEAGAIGYCQWKGLWRATGDGDIDLLVRRTDAARFRTIVEGLGFKAVLPSGERQLRGVESFFGHEPALPRPIHLHVHYQLIAGDYWRTVYRLPIEEPMLQTATPGDPFPVPAPAYQFLVYVLRMMLRLRGWPFALPRSRWLGGIQGQLDYLEGRCDRDEVGSALAQHLPSIDLPFLDRCLRALRAEGGPLESAATRWGLHRRLRAHVCHPSLVAVLAAAGEKVLPRPLRPMLFDGRMRPGTGGLVVALIGGDGAGKSTCARELRGWLATHLPTMHAHLGRPPRSLLTLASGGALKAEGLVYRLTRREPRSGTYLEMLRYLCTARDRYHLYRKVQRFAARGGLAICERYPIPQNRFLVGPCIPGLLDTRPTRWAKLLAARECRYYETILPPDVICVLLLDPELAVRRKPEEPADYVRTRARVIWETDWTSTPAHVIDASRSLDEVLQELRHHVWAAL
jgi:thymidylate kinase